jgi:hypothetical protein
MTNDDPGFEIEHGHDQYTTAELLEQAQANAQATIIATVAFLQESGFPIDAWADAVGRRLARGWDPPRPWDAGEFMDAMLTNLRALGADVRSVDLGLDRAEAITVGFPDPDLCVLFGVEPVLASRFHGTAAAIARDRDLEWTWTIEGDRTHLVAARAEG